MNLVRELNETSTWKEGPGGRGFVQSQPQRRVCGGLTKVLRQRIKAGKRKQVRTIAVQQPGWRILASSKRRGTIVHRLLMHQLICAPMRKCYCPGKPLPCTPDRFSIACQEAAQRFVAEYKLEPVAAEMIVLHPTLPIGTRFDAMFRHKETRQLVLVSWKTGVGVTNECDWTRAQTQVAWEWMTLEKWATPGDERISTAFIVYVGAATIVRTGQSIGFYAANRIDRKHASKLAASLDAKLERRSSRSG